MKKARTSSLSLFSLSLFIFTLTSCQKQMFGVDEAVWNTLHEQERATIIENYNKKEELKIANEQKLKEIELENERVSKEIEAQTAPLYVAADALSSICGNSKYKNKWAEKKYRGAAKIQSISSTFAKTVINIEGSVFEVSPFSKLSGAWIKGQKVKLSNSDKELLYTIKIENLDNGEKIYAFKLN